MSVKVLLTPILALCVLSDHADQNHPIAPDPEQQARIDRAAAAAANHELSRLEQLAEIEKLRALEEEDSVRFVEQVLHYYTNESNERHRRLYAMSMIGYFRIPESTIVKAVAPHVYSEHKLLREEVRRVLSRIDGKQSHFIRKPDFSHYTRYLMETREAPPLQLIRYMYERSPTTALMALLHVYGISGHAPEDIQRAERIVSAAVKKDRGPDKEAAKKSIVDAMKELDQLSTHGAWWVRVYVAEILRQHPQFRRPDVVRRLAADEHPLVRRAMSFPNPQPDGASDAQGQPRN